MTVIVIKETFRISKEVVILKSGRNPKPIMTENIIDITYKIRKIKDKEW